jgi:hypothetical protein
MYKQFKKKRKKGVGHPWLMPVILATQEDWGLKPTWGNSLRDPISTNPSQKRAGGVPQGVRPEFKCQYHKTKQQQQPKKESQGQIIVKGLQC